MTEKCYCRDNPDKNYNSCSIPQEMTDADIDRDLTLALEEATTNYVANSHRVVQTPTTDRLCYSENSDTKLSASSILPQEMTITIINREAGLAQEEATARITSSVNHVAEDRRAAQISTMDTCCSENSATKQSEFGVLTTLSFSAYSVHMFLAPQVADNNCELGVAQEVATAGFKLFSHEKPNQCKSEKVSKSEKALISHSIKIQNSGVTAACAPHADDILVKHVHAYKSAKAHKARGIAQEYACQYCGQHRTSASACTDGRVRIGVIAED